MTPTLADHALALVLLTIVPYFSAGTLRQLESRLAAGQENARLRLYRVIGAEEIAWTGAVIALWAFLARPWALLAPTTPAGWPGWVPAAGWAVTLLLCALLAAQAVVVRSTESLAAVRRQLGRLVIFLPHTGRELATFSGLSLLAAVGEEVVYRGFVLAWVAALAADHLGLHGGLGLATAALVSSLMFGLAHAYQGPAGMVRTGALGLLFAVLAITTGGLLAPMLLHLVLDLTSGTVAHRAVHRAEGVEPATASAAL